MVMQELIGAKAAERACAVLAHTHDEWQSGDRRYLSEGSKFRLFPERDTGAVAELNAGD